MWPSMFEVIVVPSTLTRFMYFDDRSTCFSLTHWLCFCMSSGRVGGHERRVEASAVAERWMQTHWCRASVIVTRLRISQGVWDTLCVSHKSTRLLEQVLPVNVTESVARAHTRAHTGTSVSQGIVCIWPISWISYRKGFWKMVSGRAFWEATSA